MLKCPQCLAAMDCGVELTRVWIELDRYITTVVESDRERVVGRASDLADRMLRAQTNLGETLFEREWDENTAPMLSGLLPVQAQVERLPVDLTARTSTRMVQ